MNVVIDARWIFKELSGIGMYTREFLAELARQDDGTMYTLLFNDSDVLARTVKECHLDGVAHMRTELLPYAVFSPRNQIALPGFLARTKADVFHSMNYMIPLRAFPRNRPHRTACVVTIHDVIPLVFPDFAPRSKKARVYPIFKRLMVDIGQRADTIITDSQASRNDIIKHMRILSLDKIQVIHCGVSARFHKPDAAQTPDPNRVRRVLYVGRADPYKNLTLLIRAFARAREALPFAAELVIAGSPDPRYPEPQAIASALGISDAVRWTGYISDEALLDLYYSADCLAHASRYEGFGLQIAEAMACGVPVVCSNAASLPEVAGDAALLHDPDDEVGFSESMLTILTEPDRADALREKGYAQAAKFTWSETVRQTRAVYAQRAQNESVDE
ncbi:MAG: glycosyltransferase involved in cell wall biosynthesis [Candidatus Promineifilaceae bacterium]|jgi:glycosyltransferase involved in cell wall biosynthesis